MVVKNRTQQKTYFFTPKRKGLGKAVAHRSSMKLAEECIENKMLLKWEKWYILHLFTTHSFTEGDKPSVPYCWR